MILEIKIKLMKNINKNNGQAMMIVVLILSGIIIGATSISGLLTARQTRQSADSGSLAIAISAADAGLEWRMFKLYEDWKEGNLELLVDDLYHCSDCEDGLHCDKKPEFNKDELNNNENEVELLVECFPIVPPPDGDYLYYNIKSTAQVKSTSYMFEQTIRLIK